MVGRRLGKYTIERQLGSGGMASVYLARHALLGREVAIKVLHGHLAEKPELRERFLREAQAIATLSHPGVVQVYDFDFEDDVAYIAMELLDGRSLEERCHELEDGGGACFPVAEAVDIISQVGAALDYAHGQGVVHRDIKPSNVMLGPDGRAVLTDFGLATLLDETRLTVDGTSAGTPSYMSPEQARGERGDRRSDIYSLGIMLYQLLAGELPFRSETLVGMLHKHLNEPPPPLRSATGGIPAHVEEAVGRALAKDPDDRFTTVGEMLGALRGEAVAAATAATAIDVPVVPAAGSPATGGARVRVRLAAIGAVVAVVALGWWLTRPAATPGEVASGTPESLPSMVPSMVPEGEVDIPSMATMTGWTDAFDDNVHGWTTSSGAVSRAIVNGGYELEITVGGQAVAAVAEQGGEYTDLELESVAGLEAGQPESGYGLVFRRVDDRNYYVFAINGLGQWSLWALEDGAWHELRGGTDSWTASSVIDTRGPNRMLVRAQGSRIEGWVNGELLVSLEDDTFTAGRVGYYAASSRSAADARTKVRFDDAKVTALPAPDADAPSMTEHD